MFTEMLKNKNDRWCSGNTGNIHTRKKEIAAFFGQISAQTSALLFPAGDYTWSYCYVLANEEHCDTTGVEYWPCAPSKKYYLRGPFSLTWNYNYGRAGRDLGLNLLNNTDLVATNPVIRFKAALGFWMTPRGEMPSSHDVITGQCTPSLVDIAANRFPGYGVITNIANGRYECGEGGIDSPRRGGYYLKYCNLLGASPGDNLLCKDQTPFIPRGLSRQITSIALGG